MNPLSTAAVLAVVVTMATFAMPAGAADLAAGAAKAKEVCASCHGMNGDSPLPENPKIGGQHADFLSKALRDYKSGARKNPVMSGFAAGLTTQDMANLAAYYASQPRLSGMQPARRPKHFTPHPSRTCPAWPKRG